MRFNVITLFPDLIKEALRHGVVGQAIARKDIELELITPRAFTSDVHHTVDDRPYGGGDGMVMLYAPLVQALASLGKSAGHKVLLSAQGKKWSDSQARAWAQFKKPITLVCGRYGGVDQRFINEHIDEEISIGDYILSGGELGAAVLIDSVARFLPGVLGNKDSSVEESFSYDGLLEAPLFTRPQEVSEGAVVPALFLSGDHAKIKAARRLLSILITLQKRPDLVTSRHVLEYKKSSALKDFNKEDYMSCGIKLETLNKIKEASL